MKTLILSANTGQGHNSCAKAISEAFADHGDECVIQDVFGLVSQKLSKTISRQHEVSYRKTPRLSGSGYRFLEQHPKLFSKERLIYHIMSIGRRQVASCIHEGHFDTVICTHVLAAMILTSAIRHENIHVKSAFVATDYSCSPGVNGTEMDLYFIPHESLAGDFLAAELPPEKVVPVGIPVQKAFTCSGEKEAAKKAFGLQADHQHLLMMCGSMGCGPLPEMLRSIARSMRDKWEITVVCGTNEALETELRKEHENNPFIHILGYEKRMPQLLSCTDLYLTKPGGLSTSEAAAAAVPMVLIDAVAGCEENNLRHFVRLGAAVTGDTVEDVILACVDLMRDSVRLEGMKKKLRKQPSCNAAEEIRRAISTL